VLLRSILGLLRLESGTIDLDGVALGKRPEDLYRRCGVCFQNPDLQLFGETVEDDVALSLEARGHGSSGEDQAAVALKRFGLQELTIKAPWELSGGQRRRLALAGAFAGLPELLILDEPFLELDYPAVQDLVAALHEHRQNDGLAIVASHESRDLWEVVDQVIVLHQGRLAYAGPRGGAEAYVTPHYGLRPRHPQEGVGGD
jgi:energy-coupling factor transporter ATP-binding protein EcfA2